MKRLTQLLALLMVTMVALGAWGATITQTESFSGIPNMWPTLTFDQFDDQGGLCTLVAIEIILTLNVDNGQLILDNDSEEPAVGVFMFGGIGGITSTDVTLLDASSQPIAPVVSALHSGGFSLTGNVGDGPGDYDPSPPDGMQYNGGPKSDNASGFVKSSEWTTGTKGFIGTGTYDIVANIIQWHDYGSIGGIEFAVTPVDAWGDVQVIYNYECIPEPSMLLALGVALLGLKKRR